MGWDPRGRVLGLVQEKAWFMVGEEKGVEDKAGEMRAQPREPSRALHPATQRLLKPPNPGGMGKGVPSPLHRHHSLGTWGSSPRWASKTAGFPNLGAQPPGRAPHPWGAGCLGQDPHPWGAGCRGQDPHASAP